MNRENQDTNILFLLQGLEVGGLEKMVVDLAKHLPPNYKITFCCYDSLGPFVDLLHTDHQVVLLKRKPGFDIRFIFQLARLIRERNIDIVHAHNNTAYFYGTLAARIAGVKKIVYTEHGRTHKLSFLARLSHRILSHFLHHAVVVAEYLKNRLVEEEGFKTDKVTFIPNGIDGNGIVRDCPTEKLRQELGLNSRHTLIGIVARLDPVKNHHLLLDAMKLVLYREPMSRLLIVGDGIMREEIIKRVYDLGLENSVFMLGERNDINTIMPSLDIFTLTSLSEGMSITLIEAMAAQVAIVATDVGGNRAILNQGECGLLVPSEDAEALAEALLELTKNNEKAEDLARKARKRYEEEFTVEQMIDRYRQVYETVQV